MASLPSALTTTFLPSPSCLADITWSPQTPLFVLGAYNSACLPPGPNPTISSYYSPGIICPSGFTVACSSSTTLASDIETRAVCCPSMNSAQFGSGFSCTKAPSWGPWSSYGCAMGFNAWATSNTPLTIVVDGSTTSTMLKPTDVNGGVNAFSVQLRWRDRDLELLRTTSQSSSQSSSVKETGSRTQTAAETVQTAGGQVRDDGGGISTGTKIAIGVVVPLAVLIAVAIGLLVWKKRKNVSQGYIQEKDGSRMQPAQVMSSERYEMHGSSVKMPTTVPQEMADSSWSKGTPPPVYK